MPAERLDLLERLGATLVEFSPLADASLPDGIDGLYLGGGYFIHGSSVAKKVIVSQLSSGYYNRVFSWGRRVL